VPLLPVGVREDMSTVRGVTAADQQRSQSQSTTEEQAKESRKWALQKRKTRADPPRAEREDLKDEIAGSNEAGKYGRR
jgi:hypothetical protein